MFSHKFHRACLRPLVAHLFGETHFVSGFEPIKGSVEHGVAMEVD